MKNNEYIVCKVCIANKGLKGKELFSNKCPYAFKTKEDFYKHLFEKHREVYIYWKFIRPSEPYSKVCLL